MAEVDFEVLNKNADVAARIVKALAHVTRLRIICAIGNGERSVLDMAESLDVGPSCLSQHLAKMRNLGVLAVRRDGNMMYYRVKNDHLLTLITSIKSNLC